MRYISFLTLYVDDEESTLYVLYRHWDPIGTFSEWSADFEIGGGDFLGGTWTQK
jgi:hypothetical protein